MLGGFIMTVGGAWALLGVVNVALVAAGRPNQDELVFAIVFNMAAFVLLGLVVLAVGRWLMLRSGPAKPDARPEDLVG
jgi:hypothetical protein